MSDFKISILDYAARDEKKSATEAYQDTIFLAQEAEALGYHRFWIAEHHNVPVLATSTPEIMMSQIASQTKHIRIGSGGIMITNYSTYKVAEQIRTLEAFYPGRIDAGIGNSPGGDPVAHAALTEGRESKKPDYPKQITDLKGYLTDDLPKGHPYKNKRAYPLVDTVPQVFVLGGSTNHAPVAGENGLGFVFAHFYRPDVALGRQAIQDYREAFKASAVSQAPHAIVAVFVLVGEDEEEAEQMLQAYDLWQYTSTTHRGISSYMPTPERAAKKVYTKTDQQIISKNRQKVIWGTIETVRQQLTQLVENYSADELLICPSAYSIEKRQQTIRAIAEAFQLNK